MVLVRDDTQPVNAWGFVYIWPSFDWWLRRLSAILESADSAMLSIVHAFEFHSVLHTCHTMHSSSWLPLHVRDSLHPSTTNLNLRYVLPLPPLRAYNPALQQLSGSPLFFLVFFHNSAMSLSPSR